MWWFLALLVWFKRAMQSVVSAHRRLPRCISTSFKSCGGNFAASNAPRCCPHTRVLNIKSHMTGTLLETVPGQVVHSIPVVLEKSAEALCSGMDNGKRCQTLV